MANIPIEKKSGGAAWWMWLLGLLLLGALIWLLAGLFDGPEDDIDYAVGDTTQVEPVPVMPADDTGTITSLMTIQTAANPQSLVGRSVNIDSLRVERVSGDSTFFVSAADAPTDNRIFAVLRNLGEAETGPGMGADGVYNVNEDEMATIDGTIARLASDDPDRWALNDVDAEDVVADQVYIRIDQMDFSEQVPESGI